MTVKNYIFLIYATTITSAISFGSVIFLISPEDASGIAIPTFFISAFFFMVSFFTLILYTLKTRMMGKKRLFESLEHSLRQSFLLSIGTIFLLLLQFFRFFSFWHIALIFIFILSSEIFFSQKKPLR